MFDGWRRTNAYWNNHYATHNSKRPKSVWRCRKGSQPISCRHCWISTLAVWLSNAFLDRRDSWWKQRLGTSIGWSSRLQPILNKRRRRLHVQLMINLPCRMFKNLSSKCFLKLFTSNGIFNFKNMSRIVSGCAYQCGQSVHTLGRSIDLPPMNALVGKDAEILDAKEQVLRTFRHNSDNILVNKVGPDTVGHIMNPRSWAWIVFHCMHHYIWQHLYNLILSFRRNINIAFSKLWLHSNSIDVCVSNFEYMSLQHFITQAVLSKLVTLNMFGNDKSGKISPWALWTFSGPNWQWGFLPLICRL